MKPTEQLHELGLGLWDGSRRDDLVERCPTVFKRWCADPSSVAPPSGEPLIDAARRLGREIAKHVSRGVRDGEPETLGLVLKPAAWAVVKALLEGAALSGVKIDCTESAVVSVHDASAERLTTVPEPAEATA